jgi:hypothetical protein
MSDTDDTSEDVANWDRAGTSDQELEATDDEVDELGEDSGEKKKKKNKKDKKKKDKKKKDKKDTKKKDTKKKDTKEKKETTKKDKEKKKDKDKKKKKDDKKKKEKKKKKEEPAKPAPVYFVDSDDDDEATENSEDARMKEMLQAWDNDDDDSSDESEENNEEDNEDDEDMGLTPATKHDLGLEDNSLDHIVLASPDFDEAMKEFESMTGITPSIVGSIRGLGIKTARVGLDNKTYIEILAPDPQKPGPLGAQLSQLEEGSLVPYHFAVRSSDLVEMKNDTVPNELGWDPDHIVMRLPAPDGTMAKWEMLFMYGHFMGGCIPYYVDWGGCNHPIATIPQVGTMKSFVVRAPGGTKAHELLKNVKDVTMEDGEPSLTFSFGSPEGTITFSSDNPKGIKFPGYEEANAPKKPETDDTSDDEIQFPVKVCSQSYEVVDNCIVG